MIMRLMRKCRSLDDKLRVPNTFVIDRSSSRVSEEEEEGQEQVTRETSPEETVFPEDPIEQYFAVHDPTAVVRTFAGVESDG